MMAALHHPLLSIDCRSQAAAAITAAIRHHHSSNRSHDWIGRGGSIAGPGSDRSPHPARIDRRTRRGIAADPAPIRSHDRMGSGSASARFPTSGNAVRRRAPRLAGLLSIMSRPEAVPAHPPQFRPSPFRRPQAASIVNRHLSTAAGSPDSPGFPTD